MVICSAQMSQTRKQIRFIGYFHAAHQFGYKNGPDISYMNQDEFVKQGQPCRGWGILNTCYVKI